MEVRSVLAKSSTKRCLAEQEDSVEALGLDRQHPAFGEGVHVGGLVGGPHDFDPGVLEDLAELGGELRVSVEHEEALAAGTRRPLR